jgi:quercetin dioxygenase-like cupin family protein
MGLATGVQVGNAAIDSAAYRGWFLGHFIPPDDLRSTGAVELKWTTYTAGETRPSWAVNREATTISILIEGHFRMRFLDGDVLLRHPGDYALWRPGIPHSWAAEAASTVLTVRYPSKAGDSENLAEPNDRAASVT